MIWVGPKLAPMAMQLDALAHETLPKPDLGVSTTDHRTPSQRSTSPPPMA